MKKPIGVTLKYGENDSIHDSNSSLRLVAQDVGLSRRKQGFDPPWERQSTNFKKIRLNTRRWIQQKKKLAFCDEQAL